MIFELVLSVLLFVFSIGTVLKLRSSGRGKHETGRLKSLPGPVQFPVLGILPSILLRLGSGIFKKSSFELLGDVKRTWGSPIALRLGNIKAVLIDDFETARKLMSSEDWANRLDDNPLWYQRSFDKHYGLLVSNGESWKEMRRFVHKVLTRCGFGRTRALEMIHEIEILNFFDHLDKLRSERGDELEIQGLFNISSFNILWRIVAGTRFSYNSEDILKMMKCLEVLTHGIHPREMGFLVFPWLRHFPKLSAYNKIIDLHEQIQNFFLNIINERRKSGEYKEKQETFIDAFLHEIDRHETENIVPNHYTDEQFSMVLVDLFLTGFVPISSCLEFLVMFMILHPEIQKKCHDEIDNVIGRNRFPSIHHNDKMPYTQAVCLEVLRHITFIPLTSRAATKDTQINGYFIPKGTIAALNLYGIHHDAKKWKQPNDFMPERFLDENGRLCNQESMLPFGTGKRVCPAEVFARVSTFTYFTYLLQKYSFELPPNSTCMPDPTPNVGLGNYAKSFRCVIRERQLVSSLLIAEATKDADDGTLV